MPTTTTGFCYVVADADDHHRFFSLLADADDHHRFCSLHADADDHHLFCSFPVIIDFEKHASSENMEEEEEFFPFEFAGKYGGSPEDEVAEMNGQLHREKREKRSGSRLLGDDRMR